MAYVPPYAFDPGTTDGEYPSQGPPRYGNVVSQPTQQMVPTRQQVPIYDLHQPVPFRSMQNIQNSAYFAAAAPAPMEHLLRQQHHHGLGYGYPAQYLQQGQPQRVAERHTCKWIIAGRSGNENATACDEYFPSIDLLVQHISVLHVGGHERTDHTCHWKDCARKKGFQAKYKLVNHIRVHTGEKPFACNYANGEKPFPCRQVGCHRRFANSSDRKKHSYTHADSKPYRCSAPRCNKCYTHPSSLRKHSKVHEGKKAKGTSVARKSSNRPSSSATTRNESVGVSNGSNQQNVSPESTEGRVGPSIASTSSNADQISAARVDLGGEFEMLQTTKQQMTKAISSHVMGGTSGDQEAAYFCHGTETRCEQPPIGEGSVQPPLAHEGDNSLTLLQNVPLAEQNANLDHCSNNYFNVPGFGIASANAPQEINVPSTSTVNSFQAPSRTNFASHSSVHPHSQPGEDYSAARMTDSDTGFIATNMFEPSSQDFEAHHQYY